MCTMTGCKCYDVLVVGVKLFNNNTQNSVPHVSEKLFSVPVLPWGAMDIRTYIIPFWKKWVPWIFKNILFPSGRTKNKDTFNGKFQKWIRQLQLIYHPLRTRKTFLNIWINVSVVNSCNICLISFCDGLYASSN